VTFGFSFLKYRPATQINIFGPEHLVVTKALHIKFLVSMLVNVNFTYPFVISSRLCAVQSVCSVTSERELPEARQQFLSPVVVPYLLAGLVYTDVCPLLCPGVPSYTDNGSVRTPPRGSVPTKCSPKFYVHYPVLQWKVS
jgi:hypothetical protein